MTQPVTRITAEATLDNLSLQDYADMFAELRGRMSLGVLVTTYGDPAWNAKTIENHRQYFHRYDKGEMKTPTREMRNVLRRGMGIDTLPPTVAEATAAASPDAAVWQVGEGVPDVVIMVTAQEPITLYVNGSVSVGDDNAPLPRHDRVTAVTSTEARKRQYDTIKARRAAQSVRLAALGVTRDEALEAGLALLEWVQP